jgi:hypothetical protein
MRPIFFEQNYFYFSIKKYFTINFLYQLNTFSLFIYIYIYIFSSYFLTFCRYIIHWVATILHNVEFKKNIGKLMEVFFVIFFKFKK